MDNAPANPNAAASDAPLSMVMTGGPQRRVPKAGPVLVTGGAGFIGANLADRLARDGRDVIVLDSLARAGVEDNLTWLTARHGRRITPLRADVRDEAAVRDAVRDAGAVVHLAAQVAVTTSLEDPVGDFDVNARGTLMLLEALRARQNPPPLIFASTNKVYGQLMPAVAYARRGNRYEPKYNRFRLGCDERVPLDFYSPYGCSKGTADQYVIDYARVFGLKTVVFRMSCVYGPRQFGTEDQGWVAHFVRAALENRPITLYGDGRQVRDILFIDDAVEAYVTALERSDSLSERVFNLGGGMGNAVSLVEMLELIGRALGKKPKVSFAEARPGDQLWYVSDTSAFASATGWRAKVGVEAGLPLLAAWLRERAEEEVLSPARVLA